MKKHSGFTRTELLIFVAVIAVLAAIAIPILIVQMEKSREATDMSAFRVAYAQAEGIAQNTNNKGVAVTNAMVSHGKFKHIRIDEVGWYNFTGFSIKPGQKYEVRVDAHDAANIVVEVVPYTEKP